MENLLPDITLEILSRLPAESVLQCRQVCKTWRALLHHPNFADMHPRGSPQFDKVGLLYLNKYHGGYEEQLNYGEYDENDEQSFKTSKWVDYPLANTPHRVLDSCNGLICFSIYIHDIYDPIYICNPVTGEHVILPTLSTNIATERYYISRIVSRFGYLPCTNEYKVIRIYYVSSNYYQPQSSKWVGSVQVYTVGGGSGWRNRGDIMYSLSHHCVLANGALNWLDDEEMKIVAFDLANEEFRVLPSPPFVVLGEKIFFQLRVLGGLLCAVHEKHGESVDIWSLKKKKSCTTCELKEQEYQSWSWHKEFSIAWESLVTDEYDLFTLTRSGKVLLWYNRSSLFEHDLNNCILSRYDPKTSTSKELDMDMKSHKAIPHLNSFISLKALGEEDTKMIGSAEGLLELETLKSNLWK